MSSDTTGPLTPVLHWVATPADPSAVVLVLHGGKVRSTAPAQTNHLSAARMRPFARAVATKVPNTAVVMLQYRMRGWNGADESPVADARWALDEIRTRFGDTPVILLGHSMGGRTAAAVADDASVCAVMALAPWWMDPGATDTFRPGRQLVVLHGTMDRWTSPRISRAATERAADRGVDATWTSMSFAGHFMLMRPWVWTRKVVKTITAMAQRCRDDHPEHRARQENRR
ncbi:alpha/beta hydrolase [Williamsia phyllosphaerae]|nr:alpha/beta fold hydrolase [Williamsia phyllosphaerae]